MALMQIQILILIQIAIVRATKQPNKQPRSIRDVEQRPMLKNHSQLMTNLPPNQTGSTISQLEPNELGPIARLEGNPTRH